MLPHHGLLYISFPPISLVNKVFPEGVGAYLSFLLTRRQPDKSPVSVSVSLSSRSFLLLLSPFSPKMETRAVRSIDHYRDLERGALDCDVHYPPLFFCFIAKGSITLSYSEFLLVDRHIDTDMRNKTKKRKKKEWKTREFVISINDMI
jgi:hypothetical protein